MSAACRAPAEGSVGVDYLRVLFFHTLCWRRKPAQCRQALTHQMYADRVRGVHDLPV